MNSMVMAMSGRQLIIFDLRSLQTATHPGSAQARVAANLVRTARRYLGDQEQIDLLGIVDRNLPGPAGEIRDEFDRLQGHGYLPVPGPAVFVGLDPNAGDALIVGRILNSPEIFKVALFYREDPGLASPVLADRIEGRNRQGWLDCYDHFYPVSGDAADRLGVLGVGAARMTLTTIPFNPSAAGQPVDTACIGPVLVVAGGSSRQHLEAAVRAHAASTAAAAAPLLIIGRYPPSWHGWMRDLHVDSGGSPGQLHFLDEERAGSAATYRDACCLVVLSGDGQSIAERQAVAAGVPIFASSAAGVPSAGPRFDPADHEQLTRLIDRSATDIEFRSLILRQDDPRGSGDDADGIARAFWQDLKTRAAGRPQAPLIGGKSPSIAILGSLPPDPASATDFAMPLIQHLGKVADLDLYSDSPPAALPPGLGSALPLSVFPFLSRRYDRVLFLLQATQSPRPIEALLRYGGGAIQCDPPSPRSSLQLFGEARLRRMGEAELRRALTHGELESWIADETLTEASFLGDVARQAMPFCVHSRSLARLIHERFDIVTPVLPLAGLQRWEADPRGAASRAAARSRLGIDDRGIAIVAFGTLAASSSPEDSLWAISMLRDWKLPATLYFVGEPAVETAGLIALANSVGLAERIRFVSAPPSDGRSRDFLLAADVAVQLRGGRIGMPTMPLIDCIAAGLPTIVTAATRDAIDAPSYVSGIANEISPVLIAEAIANALERDAPNLKREAERADFYAAHSFTGYVSELMTALSLDPAKTDVGR